MANVRPISPKDLKKRMPIPDIVIETFNDLITKNLRDGVVVIKEKEIVQVLINKGVSISDINENHWLDVEPLYRGEGWSVYYDKPGYNETYDATFRFS